MRSFALLLASLLLALPALGANPPGAPDDHFLCYAAKASAGSICVDGTPNEGASCSSDADCGGAVDSCRDNRFDKRSVMLEDAFDASGPGSFEVVKPYGLCLPADKNAEGVLDPNTHLRTYKIAKGPAHVRKTNLAVVNQFGSISVDTIKPDRLLVPAARNDAAPPAEPPHASHDVDHFKCYKVKVSKDTPKLPRGTQASVDDDFEDVTYDLKKVARLCLPVDKNGEGIKNADGSLLCYKARVASKIAGVPASQPKHTKRTGVFVNDQFGPGRIDTVKPVELCVPSIVSTELAFLTPTDGVLMPSGDVDVTVTLPSSPTNLVIRLDGNDITSQFTVGGIATAILTGLADGPHTLTANCDTPGGPQSAQADFELVSLDDPDNCEVLNDGECFLPYPSSRFLVPAATDTGYRLSLPASGFPVLNGPPIDPTPFDELDGFSPAVQILMHFPQGVDPELSDASRLLEPGCCGQPAGPPWIDTRTYDGRSLDADSPTILLDADTGERILHFIENDAHAAGNLPRQTLVLRPGEMLLPGHRYVVAMRNLKDAAGNDVVPEAAFEALRDNQPTTIAAIENRRASMEQNVFTPLATAGIPRANLVLAFDFVVQSESQLTRQMLSMRDQAFVWLATVEADTGIVPFTVGTVTTNNCATPGQVVWKEINGTYQVPLFLTGPLLDTGVQFMSVDANDVPVQNGFWDAPYTISIPCSVFDSGVTSRPALIGHGLFMTGKQMIEIVPPAAGQFTSWTFIAGGTDWRGLSNPDLAWLATQIIGTGVHQLNNFPAMPDRLRQGMLNTLVLTRMMKLGIFNRHTAFEKSPGVGVFPGPSEDVYYYGVSLGGIHGTWIASLTPDIEKFGVDVPGMNFSCMLQRSTQFTQFFDVLFPLIGLTDPMDTMLGLQLVHELWVSAEPAGYARHITADMLPGSGSPKKILMTPAWLDKQVANQCTEIGARTLELPNLADGSLQQGMQGIPDLAGPLDSALVVYDSGSFDLFDPLDQPYIPPLANVIPEDSCDPHGARPRIPAGVFQLKNFFQPGGQIVNYCNGICDAGDPFEIEDGAMTPCMP